MAEIQQLERAFKKAHAAGDTNRAGVLAREIKRLRAIEGNQENEAQAIGKTISNIPGDAYDTAVGAGSAMGRGIKKTFTDPYGAAADVGGAVESGINVLAGGVMNASDMAFGPGSLAMSDRDRQAQEAASQFGHGLKDKYWDNLGQTIQEHPVQSALDVGALYAGGAGLIGRGPLAVGSQTIPSMTRKSLRTLKQAAPQSSQDLAALGPDARLWNSSESMTGLAQGIAASPTPARNAIVEALQEQRGRRVPRLEDDRVAAIGQGIDPDLLKQSLDDQGRKITGPMYRDAKKNAPDITLPNASGHTLSQIMARKLTSPSDGRSLESRATMGGIMTEIDDALAAGKPSLVAARLHSIRMNLDAKIVHGKDDLMSLSSAEKAEQAILKQARKTVDLVLKKKIPGFAQADAIHKDISGAKESVDYGRGALEGGKYAVSPERFAIEYAKRDPAFVNEGMRADIRTAVGTQANDLPALRKKVGGEADWNRDKLATAFGPQAVDRLTKAIDREELFSRHGSNIEGGSQTASRREGVRVVEGADAPKVTGQETVVGLGLKGVAKMANALISKAKIKASQPTREALAKALMTKGPDAVKLLDQIISSNPKSTVGKAIVLALLGGHAANTVNDVGR